MVSLNGSNDAMFRFPCIQLNKHTRLSVAITIKQQNNLEQFFQLAGGGVSSLLLFHIESFQSS